ncbi:CynX/NimT family MFS transporter [Micromonospora sp. NPDC003197]
MTPPPTTVAESSATTPAGPAEPEPTAPTHATTGVDPTKSTARVPGSVVVLAGILLVAINLRAAITGLGALLDEVRTGLQLSGALSGLATTLPTIAFAVLGALTPWLIRRFTPARILVASMVALVVGQALRVVTDSSLIFLVTSALALGGIAVANVLLPMLVKQYFPQRIGLVTGAYTMMLTVGSTVAAAASVPIAHAFGSWRAGLAAWAIMAALAVFPWLPAALRRSRRLGTGQRTHAASTAARVRPGRTKLGWAMAIYFGTQSLSAYAVMGWLAQLFRDAGFSAENAGLLLAGVTALGVPIALVMPTYATRLRTLRPLVLSLSAASVVAYLGLAIAPHGGALVWMTLLAIGQSAFPLVLAAIGMRARTAEGTVALSAFTQSVGYVIAALGPLLVGLLYEATGGWQVPIGFLLVALATQTIAGLAIARPRFIEDEGRIGGNAG